MKKPEHTLGYIASQPDVCLFEMAVEIRQWLAGWV
jgi:hypothetical protein